MVKPNNITVLKGGLVRDAELTKSPGLIQFSIGVDRAGSEKGVQNPSGYFDVKVWLTASEYTPAATAKSVRAMYDSGQLVKGTRVEVVGELKQERWVGKDGSRSARIFVIADTVDVYTKKAGNESEPRGSVSAAASTSAPLTLDSF